MQEVFEAGITKASQEIIAFGVHGFGCRIDMPVVFCKFTQQIGPLGLGDG